MANACARVAVARFLEKACCQSVLDCSFVSKITVDICGYVVFFFASFTRKFQHTRAAFRHISAQPRNTSDRRSSPFMQKAETLSME